MKLPIFFTILVASFAFMLSAKAQVLFDPVFTSGSTPPAGYSLGGTTSGQPPVFTPQNGTVNFDDGSMTTSDISINGNLAYITATVPNPGGSIINTQITFSPTYFVGGGGQANTQIFALYTTNANNPIVAATMQEFNYGTPQANLILTDGIAFGGGDKSGTTASEYTNMPSTGGVGPSFFEYQTLTLNLTTTMSESGGNATITTDGTLSYLNPDTNEEAVLYTYHISTTGSDNNGSFNPITNPLTLQIGGGSDNSGILSNSLEACSIVFSDVLIADAVPEPSTHVLLGLGLILLLSVQRIRRMNSVRK